LQQGNNELAVCAKATRRSEAELEAV
jgi:hypothetical protein